MLMLLTALKEQNKLVNKMRYRTWFNNERPFVGFIYISG